MTWRLWEGLVDEVALHLRDNLPAKLDVLNTEYDDGIHLDVPAGYEISERALESVAAFPVVSLIVPDAEMLSWTHGGGVADYALLIDVLEKDQDADSLKRKLYRYMRAVWELMIDPPLPATLTYFVLPSTRPKVDFSMIYAKDSQFLADAALTMTMRKQEVA